METTLRNSVNLFQYLRLLNGQESVSEVDGQKRTITQPYQFDAKTIWAIAKNLNILKRHIEVFETARTQLIQNLGDVDSSPAKRKEFREGIEAMLNETVKLDGICKIKLAGLNLDKNAISPGLLADLAEIIEE